MVITYKYRLKDKNRKEILRSFAFGVNQAWNFCSETLAGACSNRNSNLKPAGTELCIKK